MSRRRALLILDACMAALFVVLLSWHLTGLDLHEWLGITLIVAILLHLLVHWGWMETRASQVMRRSRAGPVEFALNAGFFAAMVTTLVSGVAISKVAIPNRLPAGTYMRWHGLHDGATILTVLLLGAHFAFNWDRIRAALVARARSRRAGDSLLATVRLLGRRAASVAVVTVALISVLWMLVLVAPGSSQVMMTFPDGHRALVAPPAEVTRADPASNRANPRAALPRVAVCLALLATVGMTTRFSIVRRRRRRVSAAYGSWGSPSSVS